jgi:hypothetical protein
MEITALRKRLGLSPYEELSVGAPDKTGWMNVEVIDTLGYDEVRVVGQLKGDAFRPAGASLVTALGPGRDTGMHAARARQEAREGEAQVVCGTLWLGGGACLGLLAWTHWFSPLALLYAAAAVVWMIGWLWLMEAVISPMISHDNRRAEGSSPALDLASDDFNAPTVSCPKCGAAVSSDLCAHCGWVRPL